MYEQFIKKTHEADTVAVFMHINPDGDCVGSALALYAYLTNMGKTAHCFLEPNNKLKENLMFLPYIDVINAASLKKYDLAIAVDCGSASRMGNQSYERFLQADDQLSIDHHESGELFAKDTILETDAASTTQILYKIFKETDPELIDKDIATLLFAGLMTDTGCLSYSSVKCDTYKIASELCRYGIDNFFIIKKLFKENSLSVFALKNRVLDNMKLYLDNKLGIISFLQADYDATGAVPEDTEGIINNVIDINEVKVAISVAEIREGAYKIGIRSKDEVNSAQIAGKFGGGGHFYASGCRIYDEYSKTIERLIEATRAVLDD